MVTTTVNGNYSDLYTVAVQPDQKVPGRRIEPPATPT